jgi:hypothetical protein
MLLRREPVDVLQFIKTSHDEIREDLGRFLKSDGIKARRSSFESLSGVITTLMLLEKDYLYPELPGLFPEAELIVSTGLANGSLISKKLKLIEKSLAKAVKEQVGIEKKIEEFSELLETHFSQQEQSLMPRLRQTMRTDDREELGQVFEDVRNDMRSGTLSLDVKPGTTLRKRA